MNTKQGPIPSEKITKIIDNYLAMPKFQNNLNNLIVNSLSNRKTLTLPRNKIAEKKRIEWNFSINKTQNIFETKNQIHSTLFYLQ